jgi:hypothetical protein
MHLVQCLTQMVDYGEIDPVEEGGKSPIQMDLIIG